MHPITTHCLGFPRIGADRELKKALEAYWQGDIDEIALQNTGRELRHRHWRLQKQAGLDWVATGDFAWYDQVLTLSATLGNVPLRHRREEEQATAQEPYTDVDLDTLFRMARGRAPTGNATSASEMTKWFDTNYHYLVPEFHPDQNFTLSYQQIIEETREAVALGYAAKPVILGPLSYLWLGKETGAEFDRLTLLDNLLPAYQELLQSLADAGASWVQIDEPILVLDLPVQWQQAFEGAYHRLQNRQLNLLLATYFDGLEDNLSTALTLPVAGIHIDLVRAPEQLAPVLDRLPAHKVLSLGVVDGRNIWRHDLRRSLTQLAEARERLGNRLWLAPSCSLLHVPVDLAREETLNPELKSLLAFATQKLTEVFSLARLLEGRAGAGAKTALARSDQALKTRRQSARIHKPEVQARLAAVTPADAQRHSPFEARIEQQQTALNLPLFPTTTIGSFPQTADIRRVRRDYKAGQCTLEEYQQRMRAEIAHAIAQQEALGLDVLVHGEPERNDMVEYFGEQLDGYAFTRFGWVQSYGSRCVKPPIIYGDVTRPAAMTLDWWRYAQSLTQLPVKGMLTGPITMLCWSFVRDDQPREITARQLALALREEVVDLERAGARVIQIDEPALREGLPLRRRARSHYLNWAVEAFRLCASGVRDDTQIHTHMCYSEFNDIIEAIAALDADVITIETSRSHGELLRAFEDFHYPNDIGPGVYDIHSPNIPEITAMVEVLSRAARDLPVERLWVNPDCGLKTRNWPETEAALSRMVAAARKMRRLYETRDGARALGGDELLARQPASLPRVGA
ncbi:5-methyltetrahydropteroyltriglutamate--homocysteine S-methyltransferase [Marinimicrobium sp. ABcell2]|uniref:5-methyltetrahydropteroyltriglutamate-- homocysteine S-methyltransferase n=1 Tax=Marinimicrobium sp. ABcell2 TaxID=3069751 RepID=UPI0027AEFDF6|nr:5-methyltetrahydropteroyltriglutamate--homocysteine S-methyltransferase [Marinimicrobium sp. ABcell2]MDQ2077956.1 5-methyltetrahydropteroyltriglutamate--homocysteine S-methyltransferase [Marinimicrobium sp. ABcell2]